VAVSRVSTDSRLESLTKKPRAERANARPLFGRIAPDNLPRTLVGIALFSPKRLIAASFSISCGRSATLMTSGRVQIAPSRSATCPANSSLLPRIPITPDFNENLEVRHETSFPAWESPSRFFTPSPPMGLGSFNELTTRRRRLRCRPRCPKVLKSN